METRILPARADQLADVLGLLGRVSLPPEGVAEHFGRFFVAERGGQVVGCVGMEQYGETALLRSLAVSPEAQGCGLGRRLTEALLAAAKADGVREVVLLTTTAADFFARRFKFVPAAHAQYDEIFAASPEGQLPCCASAACLSLRLQD